MPAVLVEDLFFSATSGEEGGASGCRVLVVVGEGIVFIFYSCMIDDVLDERRVDNV